MGSNLGSQLCLLPPLRKGVVPAALPAPTRDMPDEDPAGPQRVALGAAPGRQHHPRALCGPDEITNRGHQLDLLPSGRCRYQPRTEDLVEMKDLLGSKHQQPDAQSFCHRPLLPDFLS